MFIQVIKGKVADSAAVKEASDRWFRELAPGAHGWLGCTSGVTADGTYVAVERFESADAARRNSDRPEQGQWWAEASKLFDGEVTFHDCTDTETFQTGGSDSAGFVQVIEGRVTDAGRMRQFLRDHQPELAEARPDVIGGVVALHGDGGFTQAIYFTSEAAARQGEAKEMPPEMKARMEKEMDFYEGDFTFYDLRQPWLYSP